MFFKAAAFSQAVFLFAFPSAAVGGIFEDSACMKQVKSYYLKIFDGTLERKKQDRFFLCIHDALELIVENKVFYHDPSRDYFTKSEIYTMFHVYFKFEAEAAERFVSQLFIVKKILVGGKIDQLADRELRLIYRLVYDYEKAYQTLKPEIPVFRNLFFGRPPSQISLRSLSDFLKKLKNALETLKRAYQRERAVYSISGLDQIHLHLYEAKLIEKEGKRAWGLYTRFLHLWVQGLFIPKTEIRGKGWSVFFRSFHLLLSQFAYYKNYIQGKGPFIPPYFP